jgi:hypothetical protein
VSDPPECWLHSTLDDAASTARACDGDVYDAHALRMLLTNNGLQVISVEPDELSHRLRRWLDHRGALSDPRALWPLWLLVHTAIEHSGYSD